MKKLVAMFVFALCVTSLCFGMISPNTSCHADTVKTYYTIYDGEDKKNVLFLRGGEVNAGDNYLSKDNKYYEITNVNEKDKTAIAKFIKDEKMPEFEVRRKSTEKIASAKKNKKVGVYHTHNDESYYTPDGIDSVYGKGGIHDVGKSLVSSFEKLGISVIYREDLHLPHNSGAYTRSQVTASAILNEGVDGLFDIHRDSTARREYLTTVDGKQMSSVRMVVGKSSANYEENRDFAYTIKGYADKVYPGLIKDIYFGKGNYNQQLTTRAMLFEMGCENIEKDLVTKTTPYLAKVLDVVLYGSENASPVSTDDIEITNGSVLTGVVDSGTKANSNDTLFVVLGVIGTIILIISLILIFSKNARYKVGRFFSEMFAGIFGKKKVKE